MAAPPGSVAGHPFGIIRQVAQVGVPFLAVVVRVVDCPSVCAGSEPIHCPSLPSLSTLSVSEDLERRAELSRQCGVGLCLSLVLPVIVRKSQSAFLPIRRVMGCMILSAHLRQNPIWRTYGSCASSRLLGRIPLNPRILRGTTVTSAFVAKGISVWGEFRVHLLAALRMAQSLSMCAVAVYGGRVLGFRTLSAWGIPTLAFLRLTTHAVGGLWGTGPYPLGASHAWVCERLTMSVISPGPVQHYRRS